MGARRSRGAVPRCRSFAGTVTADGSSSVTRTCSRRRRGDRDVARGTIPQRAPALMTPRIRSLVERVWNYHQLHHQISRADAILVLCSHDTIVAERGAQLFLEGWAPLLIFAGGLGAITRQMWSEPEADQFARIAVDMGVPRDRILIENRSTNTGENVRFTKELIEGRGVAVRRAVVVQKPYMERRSYATFRQLWPELDIVVTSPQ